MKEKIIAIALFSMLAYGPPLIGRPDLLLTPQMGIILAATIILFATQPSIRLTDVAADQRRDKNSVLLILFGFLIAQMASVAEWAHLGRAHPWRIDVWTTTGLVMLIGGMALRAWSIRLLGGYFTATVKTQAKQRVIQIGPYRYVRHPSYLGALLATLGCAIMLHAWAALAFALVTLLTVYWYRIRVEERALVEQLGLDYVHYQASTKRLIPFVY